MALPGDVHFLFLDVLCVWMFGTLAPGRGGAIKYYCWAHAWPEVFKTYPNQDLPSPGKTPPNWEFYTILPQNLPLNNLEDMFGEVWKMTPKCPLIKSKRTLLLRYRHILTPNCDFTFSLKKQPSFCVSLVAHLHTTLSFQCPTPHRALATSIIDTSNTDY